jgi:outer membrane immunogenic protein
MKRILLSIVSLGLLSLMSPVLAADLPPYTKAPVAVSPLYDWSGFYVGVFGGGGFGNHNINNALGPAGFANYTFNYDSTGAVAGGDVGYQLQSGQYVIGVEANGMWSDIKGSDATQLANIGFIDADNLRWTGSFVTKGGIAVDRLLLYFDGGWAYGDILHTNTNPGNVPAVDSFEVHRSGLTAGGGIAYAVTNNLIGKIDYRYYNFGTFSRLGLPTFTPNGVLPYSDATQYSVVTLGLDYKFGVGAVVAKH